ncbi:unnamed protein product [Medioppia subpectinata]|uniref:Ketosynthase family 3 (KS3) domain-containing protein n=1 Tax=Medioppia subpectinata TaxID=1979941 RepID=A0A7R9L2V7_9ACAR|nr:unnamed protein product [Medioppia subpectinata]CAG2114274.1 unnamed protein product [Medioppia subpectinata]
MQNNNLKSVNNSFVSSAGNLKCLYAHRISYVFDLKGPAFFVDSACASSMTALTLAFNDLIQGNSDYAIVCGTHMAFEPFINQWQQMFGMCSPRGVSAVFDESADGYMITR